MRETLFGDTPWEQWPAAGGGREPTGQPWDWFIAGRKSLSAGRKDDAIAQLRRVIDAPELESRQYLQAWHFLGQLGAKAPPEIAKHVYGVVIEVGMVQGFDLLAAYEDGSGAVLEFQRSGGRLGGCGK